MKIYCASKTSHAPMWQRLRSEGIPLISSWIDEAGVGQTADLSELWDRIQREVVAADRIVVYAETPDFPLKGALVEVGMALTAGVPVALVLASDVRLEVPSCRPIGSWIRHPGVTRCETLGHAFSGPLRRMSASPLDRTRTERTRGEA